MILRSLIFVLTAVAILNGGNSMAASSDNLDIALAYLKAMEEMDYDSALELVGDNVEYINGPSPALIGKQGILNTLEPFFAPIEENDFQVLRTSVNGNVVFIERLDRHRIPQGWFELPVNSIFEIENGKIVKWREYFDLATVRDAMTKLMQQ